MMEAYELDALIVIGGDGSYMGARALARIGMPVIGIPLPLLSYGGSSLWAFTVLIFIFIALYREEKKYY